MDDPLRAVLKSRKMFLAYGGTIAEMAKKFPMPAREKTNRPSWSASIGHTMMRNQNKNLFGKLV